MNDAKDILDTIKKKEDSWRAADVKYVLASECKDYYDRGHDVIYYCSKGRRRPEQWDDAKAIMKSLIPEAGEIAVTFHRGTQRTYIFVIHPENFKRYASIVKDFITGPWGRMFTEEPIDNSTMEVPSGNKVEIPLRNGEILTIEPCEDGWVNIRFSSKNSYKRMKAEELARLLRY